jgi:prepilin-type N-terminal cleavage/methylation domain-containing protein
MMAGRSKAFTLLEVVAAMVILATAVVATLAIQAGAVDTVRKTAQLSRATAAAEAELDAFMANPTFAALGDGTICNPDGEADDTVTVDGYSTDEFEIHRLILEHTPLQEQNQIELDPAGRETALEALGLALSGTQAGGANGGFKPGLATQSDTSASNDFDPGTFVAVRIEVFAVVNGSAHGKPLVTMESWLPKPVLSSTGTTTGATSATRAKSGTGTTGPSRPTGGLGASP